MIEIKIAIDEVDYEGALETLYPVLAEYLSGKDRKFPAGRYSVKDKRIPREGSKSRIKDTSPGYEDELAVLCLNHYKEKIVDSLVNILGKQGILLKVLDMEMECRKEPDDRYFSG